MKNQLLFLSLLISILAGAQPIVQPVSSGDYWRVEEYNQKLREFAYNNARISPVITYQEATEPVQAIRVTRVNGMNEVEWPAVVVKGVSRYIIEFSRDNHSYEPAGEVYYGRTYDGDKYLFKHPIFDSRQLWYRVGIVNLNNNVVAYSSPALMTEEQFTTKVFPTAVKGSTFYVQVGHSYDRLQVYNALDQAVYEEIIHDRTGLVTVVLPTLPKGIYFVRLVSANQPQFVQKILVE